jgi:hypothetical protein
LRIREQETRLILHEHDDDDDDDNDKMLENKARTMGLFEKAYVHRVFKYSDRLYVFFPSCNDVTFVT